MDEISTGLSAGGGGIVGILLTFLGIRSRVNSIEKKVDDCRDKESCDTISHAIAKRLDRMETVQDLMFKDIKELLKR